MCIRDRLRPVVQKTLLGFASGVMVAASVWSLLIPAMNMSEGMGRLAFVPSAVGFQMCIRDRYREGKAQEAV